MALTLKLPTAARHLETYTLRGTAPVKPAAGVKFDRIAYSAAHVVADPLAAIDPWLQAAVDWEGGVWALGVIPFLIGLGHLAVWKLEGPKGADKAPPLP